MVDRGLHFGEQVGPREDKGRRGPRRPRKRAGRRFLESDVDEHFSGDYLDEAMILKLARNKRQYAVPP